MNFISKLLEKFSIARMCFFFSQFSLSFLEFFSVVSVLQNSFAWHNQQSIAHLLNLFVKSYAENSI